MYLCISLTPSVFNICLFETQSYMQRESFMCWSTIQKPQQPDPDVKLQPRARDSIQESSVAAGPQALGPPSATFPGVWTLSWIGSGGARPQTSIHKGCDIGLTHCTTMAIPICISSLQCFQLTVGLLAWNTIITQETSVYSCICKIVHIINSVPGIEQELSKPPTSCSK